jgi:hypothetical protein
MFRKLGMVFIIAFLLVTAGCRISGRVLQDDGSGNLVGVEGVTVNLFGNVIMTTETNSTGYYEFNNFKINNYTFLVQPEAGTFRFNPADKTLDVKLSNINNVDFVVVKGALETYRKAIPISAGVGAGTDYQVKVIVGQSLSSPAYNVHLGNKCKTDFSDIRFTASDEKTQLSYWIESVSGSSPNKTATIWVKVKDNLDSNSLIYIYYGDSEAQTVSSGAATFDFFDDFEKPFNTGIAAGVANASAWQNTPTYDGSGQTIHPDLVFIPSGFAGYYYWMATTPYRDRNDDYENPSLLASIDGITWEVPSGIPNPLAGMPACDHNNDADLIYNANTNELWLYYQETRRSSAGCGTLNRNYLKLFKINASKSVSGPITIFDWDLNSSPLYVSPAVVQVDSNHFYLWTCNSVGGQVYVSESPDGVNWGTFQAVNLGDTAWHLNVTYVPVKGEFWMLYMPNSSGTTLNWAISTDRVNWTPYKVRGVLVASSASWDTNVYRGTVIYDAATDLLKIWYSTNTITPHTGYVTTDYSNMLDLIAISSFEGWGVSQTGGTWSASTENKKRGSMSGKLVQTSTTSKQIVYKPLSYAMSNFMLEWDLYDDTDDTAFKLVRINGSSPASQQVGIGVYTVSSVTNYTFHNNSFSYTPTSVPRTLGWHKFGMQLKADKTVNFFIDGTGVGSLVGPAGSCSTISVEGYYTVPTTFYVDDMRVRKAASTEPVAGYAGSETVGPWDIY